MEWEDLLSPEQGELELRRAIKLGEATARTELGERLLDGRGLARASDEGERLLRTASLDNPSAKRLLARRLLDGEGL